MAMSEIQTLKLELVLLLSLSLVDHPRKPYLYCWECDFIAYFLL